MKRLAVGLLGFVLGVVVAWSPQGMARQALPVEPDESTRIEEIYDHESRMFLMLYSLKGNGEADYVTGRVVKAHMRSAYGNPVYDVEPYPLLYWWDNTLWNDPEQDGVNGNEKIYQENVTFDEKRYKPCLFNGQSC